MTTVEAWKLIASELEGFSEDLNLLFKTSGNLDSNIKLSDYETIDLIFKNLKFTDEEMV